LKTSRYKTALGEEGEKQPGSRGRVDKNLLGITSKREMDRVEKEALINCEEHFSNIVTTESQLTLDLIVQMHECVFGKIYSWGGKLRTVNISKGGFSWPPPQYLENALREFERNSLLRLTPLRGKSTMEIAHALAEVHAEFLVIHPFRDGNGRIARLLAMVMSLQASPATPEYGFTGKGMKEQRRKYLSAVIQGYQKNYEPLTRFFVEALERWTKTVDRVADGFFGDFK
jgi:cell filamentation protein, protein adenylyltransferase